MNPVKQHQASALGSVHYDQFEPVFIKGGKIQKLEKTFLLPETPESTERINNEGITRTKAAILLTNAGCTEVKAMKIYKPLIYATPTRRRTKQPRAGRSFHCATSIAPQHVPPDGLERSLMVPRTPLVQMPISLHGSNGPQSVPAAPLTPTLACATFQTMADPKAQ